MIARDNAMVSKGWRERFEGTEGDGQSERQKERQASMRRLSSASGELPGRSTDGTGQRTGMDGRSAGLIAAKAVARPGRDWTTRSPRSSSIQATEPRIFVSFQFLRSALPDVGVGKEIR
jgi:hypothetical protein